MRGRLEETEDLERKVQWEGGEQAVRITYWQQGPMGNLTDHTDFRFTLKSHSFPPFFHKVPGPVGRNTIWNVAWTKPGEATI